MNKKVTNPKDSRALPLQRSADCVSAPVAGAKNHPSVEAIPGRTPHQRRKFQASNQILSSVEICSRFEKLSGRSGTADPAAEAMKNHSLPGPEPQQPI